MPGTHLRWKTLATGVYGGRLPLLDVTVGLVSGAHCKVLIDCGTSLSEAAAITDDVVEFTGGVVPDVVMTHHRGQLSTSR